MKQIQSLYFLTVLVLLLQMLNQYFQHHQQQKQMHQLVHTIINNSQENANQISKNYHQLRRKIKDIEKLMGTNADNYEKYLKSPKTL
eukprot:Pgem_evm1s8495